MLRRIAAALLALGVTACGSAGPGPSLTAGRPSLATEPLPPAPPVTTSTTVAFFDYWQPQCVYWPFPLEVDVIGDRYAFLTVYPECWPGFSTDELWRLAVSQVLAGEWAIDHPETWQRQLVGFCTDLDNAKRWSEIASPKLAHPNYALQAFSWHHGISPDGDEEDWWLAQLEWGEAITEQLGTGTGLAWKYTALTAAGLYCPEHSAAVRLDREAARVLENAVRRCAASRDDDYCIRVSDIAVTSETGP